ncbi:MAG: class I SAM-dependent methyltransferase [Gammaproteobacteria bacterium]
MLKPLFLAVVTFALASPAYAAGLDAVLAAQPAETQARYAARHPRETLEFFGIQPGMTVIEALPGRGWYSKILLPYLGADGQLIGADYALDMYPKFGIYDDAYLEAKKTWAASWTDDARGWAGENGAAVGAFPFGSMPDLIEGKVDAVLFIRALHNLARYEGDGAYLSTALGEIDRALKPGGIVGVVQHMAPEDASDEWAGGANGYLKKSFVVKTFTDMGYELVGESDVNLNPKDQPTEKDFVWRLPPTFYTSGDDAAMKAKYAAIGESNRMTLKFRKP